MRGSKANKQMCGERINLAIQRAPPPLIPFVCVGERASLANTGEPWRQALPGPCSIVRLRKKSYRPALNGVKHLGASKMVKSMVGSHLQLKEQLWLAALSHFGGTLVRFLLLFQKCDASESTVRHTLDANQPKKRYGAVSESTLRCTQNAAQGSPLQGGLDNIREGINTIERRARGGNRDLGCIGL